MNWGLIGWIFGAVATLYGIKFVFVLFKTLFSKDAMQHAVYKAGDTATRHANNMKAYLEEKVEKEKIKRQQKREMEKPTIVIR